MVTRRESQRTDNESQRLMASSSSEDSINRKGDYLGPVYLRVVATLYFYSIMALSLTICVLLQLLSWVILLPLFLSSPKMRLAIPGLILRFCSTCAGFWLNPFWHLKIVRGPPAGYHPSDTLVMVNHLSAADPWACSTALMPWEFKYVFKADLLKLPIAGWAIGLAQDLPVHFTKEKGGWGTKPGSVAAMMAQAKKNMDLGIGTLIFPEGTRSKTGGLQPFKPGFFKFAIENKCEILPCVLHNQKRLWPLGSHLLGIGNSYFVFGEPIRVTESDTVDGLMLKVRTQMLQMLPMCPLFDPIKERPVDSIAEDRGMGVAGKLKS